MPESIGLGLFLREVKTYPENFPQCVSLVTTEYLIGVVKDQELRSPLELLENVSANPSSIVMGRAIVAISWLNIIPEEATLNEKKLLFLELEGSLLEQNSAILP